MHQNKEDLHQVTKERVGTVGYGLNIVDVYNEDGDDKPKQSKGSQDALPD